MNKRIVLVVTSFVFLVAAAVTIFLFSGLNDANANTPERGDDYTITLSISAFNLCAGQPFTLVVEDGEAVSVDHPDDNCEEWMHVYTLEGLEQAIADCEASSEGHCEVEYDAEHGYPVTGYLDPEPMMADEELGFEVHDVVFR